MASDAPKERSRLRGQIVRSGRHGQYVITREAVEDMLEQLQARPVPINVEHDPTTVPVGRIVGARLEEADEGELALEAEMELFDAPTSALVLPVRELRSALLEIPPIDPVAGPLTIEVDERSYRSEDVDELQRLVAQCGAVERAPGMARFSQLPDALLVIAIGTPVAAAWWFGRGFFTKAGEAAGEELGREIGKDVVSGYRAFKKHVREMVTLRRAPADSPPITMLTLELPRSDGGFVVVEGSTRSDGDLLDAFIDAGAELLASALAYASRVPHPESLAKLHFTYADGRWQFAYGLDDAAELVMVAVIGDEQYDRTMRELQAREDPHDDAEQ